ncbi:MAG: DUF4911 domain-containing protein [Desulfobulbaceae bacterium]|nr:DUF4911 domain-containing protein [Desulfobulbaceae bacterium]
MANKPPMLAVLYTRIPLCKVALLKFLLEGYDGLAILTTVNREIGLISIRYFPSCRDELVGMLESIQPDLV